MQFQSTLDALKHPPPSYQQPSVDLPYELDVVEQKLSNGSFSGQYDFDIALHRLEILAHDFHLNIMLPTVGIFAFQLRDSQSLVSISSDGKSTPKVYSYGDITATASSTKKPLPIMTLGGQSTFDYLKNFAAEKQASGLLEPHADWNDLMDSPFHTFKNTLPEIIRSSFFTSDALEGTLQDGSFFQWKYVAQVQVDLTKTQLTSGQEIYDNWIIKQHSDPDPQLTEPSLDENTNTAPTVSPSSTTLSGIPGLPTNPLTIQDSFGVQNPCSCHIIDDGIAVLSLPTFDSDLLGFSLHIQNFITKAKEKGAQKVIIDLQTNSGGKVILGFDAFKQVYQLKS